jgi:hypothetical protein
MKLRYLKNRRSSLDFSKPDGQNWDVLISAYNNSERVRIVFDQISAKRKYWIALPEYDYTADELCDLPNLVHMHATCTEAEVVEKIAETIGMEAMQRERICIDLTGFMRPHILYLIRFLYDQKIRRFDAIYTEPEQYARKEYTAFSNEEIHTVRQVLGYEGVHNDDVSNDILILGVGYDDSLVSRVSNDKDGAHQYQLLSLPSLSADMYQESILRLDKTSMTFNPNDSDAIFFAPANDPFVVAFELSEKLAQLRQRKQVSNVYLCPLATKPQTLGFAIFYLTELINQSASVLFPFCNKYQKETSTGVGRSWRYEVQLPES